MPDNPQTREEMREALQRAWNDWQTLPPIDFTPAEANHIAAAILARHSALSTVNVDEAAVEAAIKAMGWTDPTMIAAARKEATGHHWTSYGFGGDCFLTADQVTSFRICLKGARAALTPAPDALREALGDKLDRFSTRDAISRAIADPCAFVGVQHRGDDWRETVTHWQARAVIEAIRSALSTKAPQS